MEEQRRRRHRHCNLAGKPIRILRQSIFIFLKNFHRFTSTPCLLAFPFSLSTLLVQTLTTASFPSLRAAASSDLNLKLAQTVVSFLFTLPFALSFLLLSKASAVRALSKSPGPIPAFPPLLATQLCNSLILLSANAACFYILIPSFNVRGLFLGLPILSAIGAVVCSVVIANARVVCNLSLIVSAVEGRGGFGAILKACAVTRGRASTGLTLAVPVNAALVGVEALFQYRVAGIYLGEGLSGWVVAEAAVVAYLYATVVVLDTVVGCVFLSSCCYEIEIEERSKEEAFQSLL